jgi:hypothetical protein
MYAGASPNESVMNSITNGAVNFDYKRRGKEGCRGREWMGELAK